MSYKSINTYTKILTIDGKRTKVTVDFLQDIIIINGRKIPLQEYMDSDGDMEDFLNDR